MKTVILTILLMVVAVSARITEVYDAGIGIPYQGKSTHNYEDFYTYYAQSFIAPETWLIDMSIPLYKNDNNASKNNPTFTIELWDDEDNVLAMSDVFAAATNDKYNPVYYDLGTNDIELIVGDTYWAVINPLPDVKEEAWVGFYTAKYNACSGSYNKQYFAPDDNLVTGTIAYAYYMTFSPEPLPEPMTIMLLSIGAIMLRRKK